MKMKPVPRTSPASPRHSIAFITLGFILMSAALHVLLGGSLRVPWAHNSEHQHVSVVSIERISTPAPTPTPPQPPKRQTTERPTHPEQVRQKAQVHPRSIVAAPAPKGPAHTAAALSQIAAAPPAPAVSAPPQPEAPATPIDARDIIISARFIHRAQPDYPQLDIDRGAEGTVIVLVTIGPDGTASDLHVAQSSGDPSLDRAALEAARLSTYAPPEVDGQPATETYRIIYTFYLD
jgi:protein TonB